MPEQVLARFLPQWQGVGSPRGGLARLREVIEQLEGVALPFSELEQSILPARVADFQPRMLDELGALGEIIWLGRGTLGGGAGGGSGDGRVALYRRERVGALLPQALAPGGEAAQGSALQGAILARLSSRGASFFIDLVAAAPAPDARPEDVLAALWELVWAGLVTNDTFQPLRAMALGATKDAGKRPPTRRRLPASLLVRGAAAPPALSRSAGRWSSVAAVVDTLVGVSATERAHAQARALLERYGVVSREAASAEALPGGFASVSAVLRAMEESGKVRRGYFVEGLSGAQFAHPDAVDRLRAARDESTPLPEAVVLAAVDPANPYGALLPWPADGDAAAPRRVAGARVVLVDGHPLFYVERGARQLRFFAAAAGAEPQRVEAGLNALRGVAAGRRQRQLRFASVNGTPALRSEHARLLERAGLRAEPGALILEARI